ncbi:MAG: hypothetical protein MJE77_22540 [Proteobacteria bacterium]|nr:hypothetical protein [Pseudomonadota bacterium]
MLSKITSCSAYKLNRDLSVQPSFAILRAHTHGTRHVLTNPGHTTEIASLFPWPSTPPLAGASGGAVMGDRAGGAISDRGLRLFSSAAV